ncbi:MAG TPA: zinc-binding dehydrogenase [Acidobacteriota bacterium]|nr:zinc-binding dehydrogenase [Acidobacteriota bacterium]
MSTFASALVLGTSEFPMTGIPFQTIFDRVAAGIYKAKPVQVFPMARIEEAHRLMESSGANGKIVVTV